MSSALIPHPVQAPAPSEPAPNHEEPRWSRRHRTALLGGAVALVLATVAVIGIVVATSSDTKSATRTPAATSSTEGSSTAYSLLRSSEIAFANGQVAALPADAAYATQRALERLSVEGTVAAGQLGGDAWRQFVRGEIDYTNGSAAAAWDPAYSIFRAGERG